MGIFCKQRIEIQVEIVVPRLQLLDDAADLTPIEITLVRDKSLQPTKYEYAREWSVCDPPAI